MVRASWPWIVVLVLLLPAGSPAPLEAPLCSITHGPVLEQQNDAGSGMDAPDEASNAYMLPGEGEYTGSLQLPTEHGVDDPADWYGLEVDAQAETVMARFDPLLNETSDALGTIIVVEVRAPGGQDPVLHPMGAGMLELDAAEGVWSFGVRFVEHLEAACPDGGPTLIKLDPIATSYYFYAGCDPFCVEAL